MTQQRPLARFVLTTVLVALAVVLVVTYLRSRDDPLRNLLPMPEPTAEESFVRTASGTKVWPTSAPLVEGAQYRYNTGHCGLEFKTDFDGSFWIPHRPDGKVSSIFVSEAEGTLTVLSHDRALFRATDGKSALLTRHEGPLVLKDLCD